MTEQGHDFPPHFWYALSTTTAGIHPASSPSLLPFDCLHPLDPASAAPTPRLLPRLLPGPIQERQGPHADTLGVAVRQLRAELEHVFLLVEVVLRGEREGG